MLLRLPIFVACLLGPPTKADNPKPFVVEVVDQETKRGVPLVELTTVNNVRFITDSAGLAALNDPELWDEDVFFQVKSHGYEYHKDGFGFRGKSLKVVSGGSARLELKRLNIAERLYRVTGAGIYGDTILAGRAAPIQRFPRLSRNCR